MGRRLPSLAAPVLAAALALSACGGTTEGTPKAESPSSAGPSSAKPAVSRPKELDLRGMETCDVLLTNAQLAELGVRPPSENKPAPIAANGLYACSMIWREHPGWSLGYTVSKAAGVDDYRERMNAGDRMEPGQVDGFPTYLVDRSDTLQVYWELLVDVADGQALALDISYFRMDFERVEAPASEELHTRLEKAASYSLQALMSR
ncbi:DUF3558 family protein [Actinosynnema pretiosum subsp. pretiosum]|uniref:DUF3558 domain-containing protein n=2 Tax=Actinosynnema TaxID=40566 RepID=C6WQX2_ACTMD|nr:DUF3558 family protein [Actinosynnema mirum]ACU40665.1 hypothetical protein Amir_6869 [Actinosynnema mirum DSM 43827]AXX34172.1 hypothetical protein APASM_6807 [Actinosynnema pretiosum subsp. pretiosum]QUF02105.1 DUF3558 family protein [Actinosynnema pretiosum subsp. pretiosum]